MICVISPAVCGNSKGLTLLTRSALFGVGSISSSTLIGLSAKLIGDAIGLAIGRAPVFLGVLLISSVAILHEFRLCSVRLPQSSWQVPARWRNCYDLRLVSLLYGFLLGFGILTRVYGSSLLLGLLWCASTTTSPAIATIVWTSYGLTKAVTIGATAWRLRNSLFGDEMATFAARRDFTQVNKWAAIALAIYGMVFFVQFSHH